jgi:hypothetical protein
MPTKSSLIYNARADGASPWRKNVSLMFQNRFTELFYPSPPKIRVEVNQMDGTKKIAVAVLIAALFALGVAVAYGYYVSTAVPSNYGAYDNYGSYGNTGPYGNNYGQWGGYIGGGMMGGYGMGMR